jgi:predicted RNA methylase
MSGFHRLHDLRMRNDAAGYEMEAMRPRFAALAARHENGMAPRAVTAYQLFQTPPHIAARLVGLLDLQRGARILEPSAGLGRLLDALEPFAPAEVVAVESAPQCAGELFRQNRAGVRILQRDFLTVDPAETGLFDAVVMNPPFHMRSDIRHIQRALTFLRPGGRLAAICMDTEHRRRAFQDAEWTPLPSGAFKQEGTNVPTAMILLKNL